MPILCSWPPESWCGYRAQQVATQTHPLERGGQLVVAWSATLQCPYRLRQRAADSHPGVERAARVLEHDLVPPTQFGRVVAPELREVAAVEPNRAALVTEQSAHDPDQRRLPRAGLADDAERRARANLERDPAQGPSLVPRTNDGPGVVEVDVVDLDDGHGDQPSWAGFQQRKRWPSRSVTSAGVSAHEAVSCAQRLRKRHPLGKRPTAGTNPSIVCSRRPMKDSTSSSFGMPGLAASSAVV